MLADENREFFLRKMSNWENFLRSPNNLSDIGGNLKQEGMHHCLRGEWTPLPTCTLLLRKFQNELY